MKPINMVINVEMVYATPKQQILLQLQVKPNSTIKDVILESNILPQIKEIELLYASKCNSIKDNAINTYNPKIAAEVGVTVAAGTGVEIETENFSIATFDLNILNVGIFGKQKTLTTIVHDGDRVAIYRNLHIDPKEARRKRAKKSKNNSKCNSKNK